MNGGNMGGGIVEWWVSKQVAETWLMLPVSCGHLSNYYLGWKANPQSRAAHSGGRSLEPLRGSGTRVHLHRDGPVPLREVAFAQKSNILIPEKRNKRKAY